MKRIPGFIQSRSQLETVWNKNTTNFITPSQQTLQAVFKVSYIILLLCFQNYYVELLKLACAQTTTNFTYLPLFVLLQVIRMAGSNYNETLLSKFLCPIYRWEIWSWRHEELCITDSLKSLGKLHRYSDRYSDIYRYSDIQIDIHSDIYNWMCSYIKCTYFFSSEYSTI